MSIFRIIIGIILTIVGIATAVIPVLPGPVVSYLALLVLQLAGHPFSTMFLVVRGAVVIVLGFLDYFVPRRGVKKFGGTKSGITGSTIGLIIAVIILPILGITVGPFGILGLIGGPFLGAYVGEMMAGRKHTHALKSAFGSFLGFAAGMILKLVVCIVMGMYFIIEAFKIIKAML